MTLLIDGYNLIHEGGIVSGRAGPGDLHRARLALANILAFSLPPETLRQTIVVFDAVAAPWGLPGEVVHRGVLMRFADRGREADDLIEELIAADSAPKRLVVVSSDHRLHRAARRRGAKAIDSEPWLRRLFAERRNRQSADDAQPGAAESKPIPLPDDIDAWLHCFGDDVEALLRQASESDESALPTDGSPHAGERADLPLRGGKRIDAQPRGGGPAERPASSADRKRTRRDEGYSRRRKRNRPEEIPDKPLPSPGTADDIFPPGYADDLLEDE